jgi:hypothetical protein
MGNRNSTTAEGIGVVDVIGRWVGGYRERPGAVRRSSRVMLIATGVCAVAVLAGCGSGQLAAAPAVPVARPTLAVAGVSAKVPPTADKKKSAKASPTAKKSAKASPTAARTTGAAATSAPPSPTAAATPSTSATMPASATPSPGTTQVGATCVTSANKGNCGPYVYSDITGSDGQNTWVGQDVWNPISGYSQTLHSTSPNDWYATANAPAGNTAVLSFPNVSEQYYYTNALTDWSSIYSSFSEDMHPASGTSAEAAYDIWLNNWANEVMIQHDMVNRGTCPVLATASFGGSGGVPVQKWNLCKYNTELIWQLSGPGEQSGTVNIMAMLTWLENHGYLPQKSGLTAISYGFEICSTGGKPETFTVSGFSISAPKA